MRDLATAGVLTLVVIAGCKGGREHAVALDTGDAQAAATSAAADEKAHTGFRLWDGNGDGGAKDQPGAQKVFAETCSQGSQVGCTGLALTYLDGVNGTGKDYKKAVSLLQAACDAKVPRACSALGNSYWSGDGVPKDENKAADLYKTACDGGEPRGCFGLARMYDLGKGGLPKDQPRAFALFKSACEGGVADACFVVGMDLQDGVGTSKSKPDAVRYAQRACDGGSGEGCRMLGLLYDDGTGVPKDRKKERELLAKSCDLGSATGCFAYGGLLLRDGAKADQTTAAGAFAKACDDDNAQGCYGLATCERQGWGLPRNPMGADTHLKKACDLGNATACKEFRR